MINMLLYLRWTCLQKRGEAHGSLLSTVFYSKSRIGKSSIGLFYCVSDKKTRVHGVAELEAIRKFL